MSLNWYKIQQGFIQWAEKNAQITAAILRAHDNPQPVRPYVDFKFSSITRHGNDCETLPRADGSRVIYGTRDFRVDIRYFGSWNAMAQLDDLLLTLKKQDNYVFLRQKGVIIVNVGAIIDTSALEDARFCERADVEISCRTDVNLPYGGDTPETSIIEHVTVMGTYPNSNRTFNEVIPE